MKRNVKWMQWIALIFPFYGILYSVALVARSDEDAAKDVGTVAFVSAIIQTLVLFFLLKGRRMI